MPLPDVGACVRAYLDSRSELALTAGADLFRGQFPQDVVEGVLVVETGGSASDPVVRSVPVTVQVTCRYRSLSAALAKARLIHSIFDRPSAPVVLGGSMRSLYSRAIQPPFSLGQDERQAWRVVCNYEFLVQT